jgi:hypothetical protein
MICERLGIKSKPKRFEVVNRWGESSHIAEYSLELEDAA